MSMWARRDKVDTVDLREPWQWYPVARALSRRLIYHAGPTNSGKTHNALEAFKQAPSGMYCGPLRLLAMEVFDRMNSEGTLCNLVTGAQISLVAGCYSLDIQLLCRMCPMWAGSSEQYLRWYQAQPLHQYLRGHPAALDQSQHSLPPGISHARIWYWRFLKCPQCW